MPWDSKKCLRSAIPLSVFLWLIFFGGVRLLFGQTTGTLAVDTDRAIMMTAKVEKSPLKITGKLPEKKSMILLAGPKTLIRAIVITDEPIMTVDAEGAEKPSGAFYERIFDCEQVSILKGITTLTPVYGKVVEYPTDKVRFYVIDRGGAK